VASVCDPGPVAVLNEATHPSLGTVLRLRLGHTRTVVVITAHLDEELYGAGGLMASLTAGGAAIQVLAVTDGDGASERDPGAAARLGRRCTHLRSAYQLLGLDFAARYRLGLHSGTLADTGADILAAISELLGFADPAGLLCLAPWIGDTHPDHVAAGRAATLAAQAYSARLLYYSITGWDHPALPVLPPNRARRFTLPTVLGTRKHQALAYLTPPDHRPPPSGLAPGPTNRSCEVFIT
jgi:LmbE family N-acetylglucosaminyl deacetylase